MRPSEMNPERWRRVDEILDAALEIPHEDRAGFLAEACDDDELRGEVEALLEAEERAGTLFEPSVGLAAAALEEWSGAEPMDPQVGPFRLLREIGRGGMGVVYLAEDTRLGRYVALKALPPYLGVERTARRRFASEARAISALDHPNIATLHEVGVTEEGQHYMVFAYYEGETLEERIARGPLPPDEALEIAIGIARGLEAAHERDIVHRDVKPSNVLLTESGEVKLLDFGVAKVAGEEVTREGVRPGTVAYMSPEQASGAAVDRRTDLWSLGVVLHEALTGERPAPPTSLRSDLRSGVEAIVLKLLSREPDDRYASAADLLRDLRAVRAGRPPTAAGAARRPGRTTSRLARTALVGLAVLGGAVWFDSDAASTVDAPIERLAVLPLENRTGDPDQRYFVDGVHEALTGDLGRMGTVDVVSRASVMRFRDATTSISEIARELGVDAVVEGSVSREGDTLAVAARLVAAAPERRLWEGGYRRGVEDVYEVTGRLARSIAAEVGGRPGAVAEGPGTAPRRVDPAAYDAYLLGRFHRERRSPEGFAVALRYFERAIQVDPTFAPAYAALADAYGGAAQWGVASPAGTFPKAKALAGVALRLDPGLADAHTALATVALFYEWDWAEAERRARRAIELDPGNLQAHVRLAQVLGATGRSGEAEAAGRRARGLRRVRPGSDFGLAFTAFGDRDFDATIEHARAARDFDPSYWQAPWLICLSLAAQGSYQDAIRECENAVARAERNPIALAGLGQAYGLAGRRAGVARVMERLEELGRERYVGPSLFAIVYGGLGDRDRAFEWLERAYEERDALLLELDQPFFDPLRDDPRFDDLLRRIGFGRRE